MHHSDLTLCLITDEVSASSLTRASPSPAPKTSARSTYGSSMGATCWRYRAMSSPMPHNAYGPLGYRCPAYARRS